MPSAARGTAKTQAVTGSQELIKPGKPRRRPWRPLRLSVLAGLLVTLGLIGFYLKFWVIDLDLWVHLRLGDWILDNLAFPHTGLFSRTAGNRPWIAYSWGYEVLFSRAYAWFGLIGVAVFETLMILAVAYAFYWMIHRLSGRFWLSCLLATVAGSAFLMPVFALRCCSVVLFIMTLTLILEANRSGRLQLLYWLPLIFLVWASLHIQFIYGIGVVGLFVTINLLQRLGAFLGLAPRFLQPPTLPARPLAAIFAACLLATCLGPYSFHLYQEVYTLSKAKAAYTLVIELQPPDFGRYTHYAQLLLAAAAFVALGWKKQVDVFKLILLALASVVAFRTVRDSWFMCVTAAACIADFPAPEATRDPAGTLSENLALAAIVVLALWLLAPIVDFNPSAVDRAVRRQLPVDAVEFLSENPRPGPLYNTFDWGNFLIWALPDYPVAIDGRTDLYGDQMDERFALTARGVSYQDDPYLNESRLILLQRKNILAKFLAVDPRFELIYQDRVAVVFARR
ncbi:MAG: hypothetical protein ABSD98_11130 [Candidatus Korobacteraceae bacterium]|jgi:hypothetical protein